jgi:pimeloyl-ACP methyl ester carboxylesterase
MTSSWSEHLFATVPLEHEHLFAVNRRSEPLFVHARTVRSRCDRRLNWVFSVLGGPRLASLREMTNETTMITTGDGRRLCVQSAGAADGRPIVVHHGTPGSRHLSDDWVAAAAADGVRLISYDRPGYGGSTPQPGRTVADCASDVRAIAAEFGYGLVAVWGWSGGGPHALACAALLPDLVCAVASLGSIAPYGPPDLDYFDGMGQENVDDIKLQLADPATAHRNLVSDRDGVLSMTEDQVGGLGADSQQGFASLVSPEDAAAMRAGLGAWWLRSMQIGLEPGDDGWWDDGVAHFGDWGFDASAIGVPVQLWHGRHDRFVPFQHGEWLARHIPGVNAHITDEDGHMTLFFKLRAIHAWLLSRF